MSEVRSRIVTFEVVRDGDVLNDPTLELLSRTAVAQAQAGADIIEMIRGHLAFLREQE